MEGIAEGMERHWKDKALLALMWPYKVSETDYNFPYQNMDVSFVDEKWYFRNLEITREHVAEIYTTELYFEEDEKDA